MTDDVKRFQRQMNSQRKAMVERIRVLVEPHMHDSGYKTGPSKNGDFSTSRHIRMWSPEKPVRLRGMVLDEIIAISEFGPVTDAEAGGCVIGDYAGFPVEDIVKLYKWAVRTFPAPVAVAKSDGKESMNKAAEAVAILPLFKGSFFEVIDKGASGVQVSFNYDGSDGASPCSKWFTDGAAQQIRESITDGKVDDDYLRARCDLDWNEIRALSDCSEDVQTPKF